MLILAEKHGLKANGSTVVDVAQRCTQSLRRPGNRAVSPSLRIDPDVRGDELRTWDPVNQGPVPTPGGTGPGSAIGLANCQRHSLANSIRRFEFTSACRRQPAEPFREGQAGFIMIGPADPMSSAAVDRRY